MNPKFIAGPCVIESAELLDAVAERLVAINRRLGTEIVFKASFDKANRTSIASFRGPGIDRGLRMLADVRAKWGLKLLTDIHEAWQAAPAGEVVDVIQIPAFLCRQTDLLVAAAKTGRTVNVKKAQFLSGEDMRYPYEKAVEAGAREVWLTERGNIYGYNNLVVDFRNIPDMLRIASTVVMDCTHSVQRPGAAGGKTGGNREFVPSMALAARAFGSQRLLLRSASRSGPRPERRPGTCCGWTIWKTSSKNSYNDRYHQGADSRGGPPGRAYRDAGARTPRTDPRRRLRRSRGA